MAKKRALFCMLLSIARGIYGADFFGGISNWLSSSESKKPYDCFYSYQIPEKVKAIEFKQYMVAIALCTKGIRIIHPLKDTQKDISVCEHPATAIAIHPEDGNIVAYGCDNGSVYLNAETCRKDSCEGGSISALAFNRNGMKLAAISDSDLLIYNTENNSHRRISLAFVPKQLAFNWSGTFVYFCNNKYKGEFDKEGSSVQIVESTLPDNLGKCTAHDLQVHENTIAYGCDNGVFIEGFYGSSFCSKNVTKKDAIQAADFQVSGAPLVTLDDFKEHFGTFGISHQTKRASREKRVTALTHDTKRLVVGLQNGQIIWFELDNGTIVRGSAVELQPIVEKQKHTLVPSEEGYTEDSTIKVLTPTGHEIQHLKMHSEGNMFASMAANGELKVWQAND